MSTLFLFIIVALVGYILGSISFAVIIAKKHGIDIFKEGSGNPGATNVKRVLGKKMGNTVFVLDFLKGLISTAWPIIFIGGDWSFYLGLTGLIASVLGHNFSIFLKFRGGKGIATTMGGTLILLPWAFLIGVLLWIIVFYSTRYVSLASVIFGLSLPIVTLLFNEPNEKIVLSGILALLIAISHRSNILKLLKGTETRFAKKPKS